jgi:hypothetical protein
MKRYLLMLFALPLAISSCKKEKQVVEDDHDHVHGSTANIEVLFANYVGDSALILDTKEYKNENGDTFTVSTFDYYISNIQLTASDNSVYKESESYHLLQASDASSLKFNLTGLPEKTYTSIEFTIGVDSTRNVSGAQTGALDPAKGMFWNWNSGYIMAKFEGTSSASPLVNDGLMLHIGGFSGANNVLKKVKLTFPTSLSVDHHNAGKVAIKTDLLQWFKSPQVIDFSVTHTVHMPSASAKNISDNYADMFTLVSASN